MILEKFYQKLSKWLFSSKSRQSYIGWIHKNPGINLIISYGQIKFEFVEIQE